LSARLQLWIEEARLALRRERSPLVVAFLVTLVAKLGALLPGYSIDDYLTAGSGPPPGLLTDVLSKGRLGHWLFLKTAIALQVEPNGAQVLFVLASMACYAFFGLAVVRFWGVAREGWLAPAAAAIVANHPYTCEIFTFRIGLPLAATVLALLGLALFLCTRRSTPETPLLRQPSLPLAAVLVAAALSLYQIALHFAGMIVLTTAVLELARGVRSSGSGPAPSTARPRPWKILLAATALGVGLYGIVGLLLQPILGVSSSYFALISPAELEPRLVRSTVYVAKTFLRPNALIPPLVRLLFLLILALGIAALCVRALRPPIRWRRALSLAAILVLLALAALWTLGIFVVLKSFWLTPRSMAHTGILWAGGLTLAVEALPSRGARRELTAAAWLIVVSFVGVNQQILADQQRLNRQDMLEASRIVGRLEALPGVERIRRVAFVGGEYWHPSMARTMWGDMNISAFGASWSRVALLQEASGYNWKWATAPGEKAAAGAYCARASRWPATDSIAIQGQLAIVCMTP
jgi:hypothetical protein